MQLHFAQTIVGPGVLAECGNVFDTSLFGQFFQLFEALVITIEKRIAAWNYAFENLRLSNGDFFQIGEMTKMCRCNQRDQRHMRAHHLHQRTNFVVMVHADFENAVIRIGRHARKRQRHTPMIVERRHRSMDLADFRKNVTQGFLGRRLANRTSHRDDLRLRACPRGNAKLGQGLKHILDHDHRYFGIAECGQTMLGHHKKTRTSGHGAGYEIMPVELFALDGEKSLARFQRTAVD